MYLIFNLFILQFEQLGDEEALAPPPSTYRWPCSFQLKGGFWGLTFLLIVVAGIFGGGIHLYNKKQCTGNSSEKCYIMKMLYYQLKPLC